MTPFDRTIHITQKTVVTNLWCTLEWHPSVIEGESGCFINHVPNMGKLIMKHRQEGAVVSIRAFLLNISCAQERNWIECYILATVVKNTNGGWIGVTGSDQQLSWEQVFPPFGSKFWVCSISLCSLGKHRLLIYLYPPKSNNWPPMSVTHKVTARWQKYVFSTW